MWLKNKNFIQLKLRMLYCNFTFHNIPLRSVKYDNVEQIPSSFQFPFNAQTLYLRFAALLPNWKLIQKFDYKHHCVPFISIRCKKILHDTRVVIWIYYGQIGNTILIANSITTIYEKSIFRISILIKIIRIRIINLIAFRITKIY